MVFDVISFNEGERILNHVLGVLCHTAPPPNRDFLRDGWVVDAPPPSRPQRCLQDTTLGRELLWTLASLS